MTEEIYVSHTKKSDYLPWLKVGKQKKTDRNRHFQAEYHGIFQEEISLRLHDIVLEID